MAFVRLDAHQRKMRKIREEGELIPVKFGFKTWDDFDKGRYLMGSRKCTMLIGGEPNHGKSQFANELVMQLIEKHKFKVALFSTESGDVEKIFSQFCGYYEGKPYSKVRADGTPNPYAMSDDEATNAEYFLVNHLYVFKQDRKDTAYQTLENIYKELARAEIDYDIKFDAMVIDPIYDVSDFEPKAEEVLRVLNRINLEAEENNRFDIIVNHVAETAKMTDKSGNRRKLLALADEFYGGKNNNRKAMLQVLVHRPIPTVNEDGSWIDADAKNEKVIMPNQTDIHILKVKPEGIAKFGTYDIYYDWKSRRYYEKYDENGFFRQSFAECVKFSDREPSGIVKVSDHKLTPEQAFEPTIKNYYETEDDDEFPY